MSDEFDETKALLEILEQKGPTTNEVITEAFSERYYPIGHERVDELLTAAAANGLVEPPANVNDVICARCANDARSVIDAAIRGETSWSCARCGFDRVVSAEHFIADAAERQRSYGVMTTKGDGTEEVIGHTIKRS